jgi:exodeoxyribonuclease VII large subunit
LTLDRLAAGRAELGSLTAGLRYASPDRRLRSEHQRLDESARRALSALSHHVHLQMVQLGGMERRIQALNPMAVLSRGYAVVTRERDGRVVARVSEAGERMVVRVSDGEFKVRKDQGKKD